MKINLKYLLRSRSLYLQESKFNIGLKKQINNRLFMFHAIDNKTLKVLSKKDDKRLIK